MINARDVFFNFGLAGGGHFWPKTRKNAKSALKRPTRAEENQDFDIKTASSHRNSKKNAIPHRRRMSGHQTRQGFIHGFSLSHFWGP
jgi:hypothetical protein